LKNTLRVKLKNTLRVKLKKCAQSVHSVTGHSRIQEDERGRPEGEN